jgi:hypothetical protein
MDLQTLTTNHYAINIQANQGNQQIKEIVKLYSDWPIDVGNNIYIYIYL